MDPLPYNVTLSSQTASISYSPAREGSIDAGWNSTYSAGSRDTGYGRPQGLGTNYHRTTLTGASLEFEWIGTAVYLYGNATAGSYSITVDGQDVGASNDVPQGGLLGRKIGLKYGDHTAKLTVLGKGEVAFEYAQVTIGLGYTGSNAQNRTVYATNEQPTAQPNPFFQFKSASNPGSWSMEPIRTVYRADGSKYEIPRQVGTGTVNDALTFTINQTSAFFLWGTVNVDHQTDKRAMITGSGQALLRDASLNDTSNYLDFEQIIYWASGLDREQNYTVQIVNGGTGMAAFGFNKLELIDSGPTPTTPTTPATGDSGGSSIHGGAIAGIVVGCIGMLMLVLGVFFWRRRQRMSRIHLAQARENMLTTPIPTTYAPASPSDSSYTTYPSSFTTSAPMHATDAGPMMLPPEYQPGWSTAADDSTPQGSQVSITTHGTTSEKQRPTILALENADAGSSANNLIKGRK
ncbi:hypothetical protein V5O48_006658 [Marasmius crinis-equi]|uniref:PA14 domain-containing protein n=1 Tax=Marasmius crinis-equi TaxID=585013 RepID=A0ABR3FJG8_9AGAR